MCVGFEPNAALYARTSDLIFFNSGVLPNILHHIHYITLPTLSVEAAWKPCANSSKQRWLCAQNVYSLVSLLIYRHFRHIIR